MGTPDICQLPLPRVVWLGIVHRWHTYQSIALLLFSMILLETRFQTQVHATLLTHNLTHPPTRPTPATVRACAFLVGVAGPMAGVGHAGGRPACALLCGGRMTMGRPQLVHERDTEAELADLSARVKTP